ncbi:hypothetical protein ACQY0O_003632 [Thecaphora frezii]
MAFAQHPRSRPARGLQSTPSPIHSSALVSNYARPSQDQAHDWSIVFPGRVKEAPPAEPEADRFQGSQEGGSARESPSDGDADHDASPGLELTLPPLHDGTGRFVGASEPSISPGPFPAEEVPSLLSPLSPPSEIYSDSALSITDSHGDADEEVGFGSGSDFESDAIASVPSRPGRSRPRTARRGSRFSATSGVDGSVLSGRSQSRTSQRVGIDGSSFISTLPDPSVMTTSVSTSRAWSWLSGNQSLASALEEVPEVASASSSRWTLDPAASRRFKLKWRNSTGALSVISTSDSEQDLAGQAACGGDGGAETPAAEAEEHWYESDLVNSNLAQSAGLALGAGPDTVWRRPKRRHRHSATGRSSKRSNTSQSQSAAQIRGGSQASYASFGDRGVSARNGRGRNAASDGSQLSRPTRDRAALCDNNSTGNKVVRKLLKRLFDLEPEVLDTFLGNEAASRQAVVRSQPSASSSSPSIATPTLGFALERGLDAPLAMVPSPTKWPPTSESDVRSRPATRPRLLVDGREAQDDATPDAEAGDGTVTPTQSELDLTRSPLFDLTRAVRGERRPVDVTKGAGLTYEALARRRSVSSVSATNDAAAEESRSVFEPTTIEALQALVNSVMPVPMPFRILGALARSLGWSRSIWRNGGEDKAYGPRYGTDEGASDMSGLGDDRRYRYDRLLSAQQAKAWSRQYRGIQLANDQEDDTSMDVPECWRGNEHPALVGDSV